MHHAMAHRLDIAQVANFADSRLFRYQPAKQVVESRGNVLDGCGEFLPRTIPGLHSDDGLATDALHLAAAQPLVGVLADAIRIRGNHLKLQAGASSV